MLAFAAATAMGTVVAFRLVPMRSLGPDNWNIAVALMTRHIGGGKVYIPSCSCSPAAAACLKLV